jgi:hypothetical protein
VRDTLLTDKYDWNMHSEVGVFSTWEAAERAARSLGLPEDRYSIIASDRREPPETGIGAPLGGAVGGAVGAAAGSSIGTAAASLLVPGVGPVIATGIVAALVLGVGGAAIGAAAGGAVEDATDAEPPAAEAFFCEEALRLGHVIVVALAETPAEAEAIRDKLSREGAESLGCTGEVWWGRLREEERAAYEGDFGRDEEEYRRGFEAALQRANRGKPLDESSGVSSAYRKGYERGYEYRQKLG